MTDESTQQDPENQAYLEMLEASKPARLAKAMDLVRHALEHELSPCRLELKEGEPAIKTGLFRHHRQYLMPGSPAYQRAAAKTGRVTITIECEVEFQGETKIPDEAIFIGPLITESP